MKKCLQKEWTVIENKNVSVNKVKNGKISEPTNSPSLSVINEYSREIEGLIDYEQKS